MPIRALPEYTYLHQRLDYDRGTGVFVWHARPSWHFPNEALRGTWNTRYAGKIAGHTSKCGYRMICVDDMSFLAHRLAWLLTYGDHPVPQEIDHIDGDRTNNRISNLRIATRAENLANAGLSRRNKSGLRGVWFDAKRGKFQVSIKHLNKQYHLGRFDTIEQAAAARREAATRLHGEFARHDTQPSWRSAG